MRPLPPLDAAFPSALFRNQLVIDEPFSKVTVAFFKAATATQATTMIGEVTATKGAAAAIKSIELAAAKK